MMLDMNRLLTIIACAGLLLAAAGCSTKTSTSTLTEKSHFAFWSGQWAKAQSGYAELVQRFPENSTYQFKLGTAALNDGDLNTARRALEIAETLQPQDEQTALNLAETMYRQDDRSALFTFLRDRAESTQRSEDWLTLARYSLDLDDPDLARLAIQEALVLQTTESPEPYVVAAELAERLGDIDGALRSLKIAWTLDPENPKVQAMIRGLGEVPGPTMLENKEIGG